MDTTKRVFPANTIAVLSLVVVVAVGLTACAPQQTLRQQNAPGGDGKITICHATGSAKNPYVEITVSTNGLNGHDKHAGDIIPAPVGGCPTK